MESKRSLVAGVAWNASLRSMAQMVSWGATFVLVRLLSPADYGIVGLAAALANWTGVLAEFGLTNAITTEKVRTREEASQLVGLSCLLGVFAGSLTAAAGIPVGRFFGEPALTWVLPALGVGMIFNSLRVVPMATMNRSMRVREIAVIDLSRAFVQSVLVLGLAFAGMRYWSLVLGQVGASLVAMILSFWYAGVGVSWPSLATLRPSLARAKMFFLAGLAWQTYGNADSWIIGRVLGADSVGIYSVARNLALIPIEKIVTVLTTITPGFLADAKEEEGRLGRLFLFLTESVAIVTAVPLLGLILTADIAVPVLLGAKWNSAIAPLRIISLGAILWAASMIVSQVANLSANLRMVTVASVVAVPCSIVAYILGTRYFGLVGAAWAWIVVIVVIIMPTMYVAFRETGIRLSEYFQSWRSTAMSCAAMSAAVIAFRAAVPASVNSAGELAGCVVIGGGTALTALLYSQSIVVNRAVQAARHRLRAGR